ncbi:MAG: hypothetical protein MR880_01355 [Negativibacillus massiliensis]|jgi:hypothetical protein|nr:hypothetical protein [Negativibacillus massiliensis]
MNFNQMDASALAAWIALIVAIISPILTAIINNHHQTKMKKIEMSIASKLKIIEDYLSSAGQIIYHNGEASTESYSIAIGRIYSASPRFLWEKISLLDEMIYSRNWEDAHTQFLEISQALASHQPKI